MTDLSTWPPPDPVRGRALTDVEVAGALGVSRSAIGVWRYRTRLGVLRDRPPFPEPDGYAIAPGSTTTRKRAYWFVATILAYAGWPRCPEDFTPLETHGDPYSCPRCGNEWARERFQLPVVAA